LLKLGAEGIQREKGELDKQVSEDYFPRTGR